MATSTIRILVTIALLAVGCAHDMRARYPALPDQATSSIVLLLGDSAQGVTVAVNGVLVVQDAHTDRVVIDGVPVGNADVVMTANGADKAFRVWVADDHAVTVPMGVPDGGGATSFLKTILASAITMAVYAILH